MFLPTKGICAHWPSRRSLQQAGLIQRCGNLFLDLRRDPDCPGGEICGSIERSSSQSHKRDNSEADSGSSGSALSVSRGYKDEDKDTIRALQLQLAQKEQECTLLKSQQLELKEQLLASNQKLIEAQERLIKIAKYK